MMNNYIKSNNLPREDRLLIDVEDDARVGFGRGMLENQFEDNIIPQIMCKIKDDLDQINNLSISEQVRLIKAHSLDEIRKITNNSKYFSQIEDIFNRDTESLEEHFNMIQATIANKKISILKTLSGGMERIQEEKQILQQGLLDPNNPNMNALNYVYDDEFVTLINSLSSSIKEFFKKSRSCFTTMKNVSEQMIEHLLNSKSSVSEALVHVNSMMLTNAPKVQKNPKDTAQASSGKEKIVKDKINILTDKLDNLNETRINFLKNLKILEQNSAKFYEEAKVLFKKMKESRNDKLDEYNLVSNSGGINNYNQTLMMNNMATNYNQKEAEIPFNNFKHKSMMELLPNSQARLPSNSPTANNKVFNFATNAINLNNNPGYNPIWNNIFDDIQKEEKIIGETLESFKKRNQELTKELEIVKKKFSDLKVENISLKEKLRSGGGNYNSIYNSNYNSNYHSNADLNNVNEKETSFKIKSASSDPKTNLNSNIGTNNINNSNQKKAVSSLKEDVEKIKSNTGTPNAASSTTNNLSQQYNSNDQKQNFVKISVINTLKQGNDNKKKENTQKQTQPVTNSTKPKIVGSVDKKTQQDKATIEQPKSSVNNSNSINPPSKTNENQKLYSNEEKTLAESVISFMSQMGQLQENIAKKAPNVAELKKDFELKKRELIKYAEKISNTATQLEINYKSIQDNYFSNTNYNSNNLNSNNSRTGKPNSIVTKNKSMHIQLDSMHVENAEEHINNLNKMIASLKEEINHKLKEMENLNENNQKEKNRNSELEKKYKDEKMISNLIKEKLQEEKEKNKNLEIKLEQIEEKFSDNKISLNLENKMNELNVKNKELLDLIKKSEEEIKEVNSKLKSTQEECEVHKTKYKDIQCLNEKIENLTKDLKMKEEKIIDLTLAKDKNSSSIEQIIHIQNENEKLIKIINSNQTEISQLKEDNKKLKDSTSELDRMRKIIDTLEEEKLQMEKKTKSLNQQATENNKNLSDNLQKLEQENQKLTEMIQNDKNSLLKQMQGIVKENENLQEILTYVEKERDQLTDELNEIKEELDSVVKAKSQLHEEKEKSEKTQTNLLSQIKSLEEQKQKLSIQIEEKFLVTEKNFKNQIETLNSKINSQLSEISKLTAEKEKVIEEKILILKGVENLNIMLESLSKDKTNYLNEMTKLKEEKLELTYQISNLQNDFNSNKQKFMTSQYLTEYNEKSESNRENQKLKKENEKLNSDIVELNNMNDFLKKELSETNRLLNEQIISHKQDLNNSYLQNQEKNKEKLEDKEIEIEKLNKKLEEANEKKKKFNSLFEEIKDETNKLKDNKISLEKILLEKEEIINKLNGDYQFALKESKEMKNRLAQFKMEFNSIHEEKENELEKIRENYEILSTNEMKYVEQLKNLLLKMSAWEGSKLNLKKNYNMEDDNFDIFILFDEVSEEVEKLYRKLIDLQKKTENENKMIELKLSEINQQAEKKLKDFVEENKKLKMSNDEYIKKIIDTVKDKAPHLMQNNTSRKNSDDFGKAIELFKLYNEELNKINALFEDKFIKAMNQAKKYKELYLTTESKNSSSSVNPKDYKIISDKIIGDLKWLIVTEKSVEIDKLSFDNTLWIKVINNKINEFNLSDFNQFKTENEKNKEISDLLNIQNELISKLNKKEDEISKMKNQTKSSSNNINSVITNQGNNIGDTNNNSFTSNRIRENEENSSKKLVADYYVTKDFYSNLESISLDKYQKLLDALIEEQEKNKHSKSIIDKLTFEYESIRNILEQNRSKIERQGNFSEIREIKEGETSRFLDDSNMNDMFLNNEVKILEGTRRSIARTDRNSEMGDKADSQIQTPHLERRNSKESIKTVRRLDTQSSVVKDSYRDNVMKLEENEKLLSDQLLKIKEELKDTRNQRDLYKRKYEESITLQNGKKNEIVNMLKQAFEKLVAEIAINNKTKEYITVILKILDYNEFDINRVLKKEKKGIFSGIFTNNNNNTVLNNSTNK